MKNRRILDALGQIDEKYIEEAAPAMESTSPKKSATTWMKWLSLTACATIAVLTGFYLLTPPSDDSGSCDTEQTPVIADNLPLLTSYFESDGMGFEGLMFYEISESGEGNPWTEETKLTTLPVYRNLAYTDGAGAPIYLSDEEMLQLAETTAASLGTVFDTSDIVIESTDLGAYSLTVATQLGEIQVNGNGLISVFFSEPTAFPGEYPFRQPVVDISVHYTFSGEQRKYYHVYEGNGSMEEQILNYNFNAVSFSDDEGTLQMIHFGNILDSTEKIGDYPLITADTAQKLLLDHHYITSVPSEYLEAGEVQKEHIAKVELVYRTGNTNEVFMPYYRFYVELTEFDSEMAEGLKNYGAYYVPAVSGEYLSDFPVWDGSFN